MSPPIDVALSPLAPGPLLRIAAGATEVDIAPTAGGRVARIVHEGLDWLQGWAPDHEAALAWGCYPMVPWAGRIRGGRFRFDERDFQLPPGLGAHAIHGVGFTSAWQVESHGLDAVELSLRLPEDERWPFGGTARQRIAVLRGRLRLELSVTAGAQAMPAVIGWHPWLRKPDQLAFAPEAMYPRDRDGIATLPLAPPSSPPWDDCFVHAGPILAMRGGQVLRLSSDCRHWVVYDELAHVTCVEPQSGPPDAFNLVPSRLEPHATRSAWFAWDWL
jgi:aldose 1-epimerase